eukprot:5343088-Ditylum_brightwellii.AAC.1
MSLCLHINDVISNHEIDVIHDAPYPDFEEYVLEASERIRGRKPIVLLSERDPDEWAASRMSHHEPNSCRLDLAKEDGISPIGAN